MSALSHMSDLVTFASGDVMLQNIMIHLSVSHTSTELIRATLQAKEGSAYNCEFFEWSCSDVNNLFHEFSGPILFQRSDAILFSGQMSGAANFYGIVLSGWAVTEG